MKKKLLTVLLSLFILSLAAGCSDQKTEPEKETVIKEEQSEADPAVPEDTPEPESEAPALKPEEPDKDEKEEGTAAQPEAAQPENVFGIPSEKGMADENTTAVAYYEFKKDYGSDGAKETGTLEFKIPQLTMKSVEAGKINEDIIRYFEERLDEADMALEDLSAAGDFGGEDPDMSVPYTLEIGYDMTYLDENRICLLLSGYEYSGGAHGMPFRKTLVYDLETGERMAAKDLFDVSGEEFGAAYIAAFEARMAESPDDYWADAMDYVKEGASFENEDFYLTESGTVFYFEPYTLAAYAYGYIEAEVPYDKVGLK